MPMAHPVEDVIANATSLIEAFRKHQLPVVLINVAGSLSGRTDCGSGAARLLPDDWTDLIDEPSDILVTKYTRMTILDLMARVRAEQMAARLRSFARGPGWRGAGRRPARW